MCFYSVSIIAIIYIWIYAVNTNTYKVAIIAIRVAGLTIFGCISKLGSGVGMNACSWSNSDKGNKLP